jgi:predicted HAD superfamily Cof-like phosphohydrolase
MSTNWVQDISDMHAKFGVNKWVDSMIEANDTDSLRKFLEFRLNFLVEELIETGTAANMVLQQTDSGYKFVQNTNSIEMTTGKPSTHVDSEEVVDGLIDLCVVAIGTLDAFSVDAHKAWDAVHNANMSKEPGVKPSRPNPLGLPDLIKPEGWTAPSHQDNHGSIGVLNT